MKKLVALLAALALCFSACALAISTENEPIIYGKVKSANGSRSNVYNLPGEYRTVVTRFDNGAQVIVLFEGSTWHKVRLNNSTAEGWMKASEITITTRGLSALNFDSTIKISKQTRSNDNKTGFRWGPGTEYDLIDELPNGTYAWVFETVDNWSRVLLKDGRIGYISSNLLGGAERIVEWPVNIKGYVQVSGNSANFRDANSYSSNVIGQLKSGDVVEILSETTNYFFEVVDAGNRHGYVSEDILSPGGINRTATYTQLYYDNPYNYAADVIWDVDPNTTVKVLATDGYVSRVQYGDVIGYVKDYQLVY